MKTYLLITVFEWSTFMVASPLLVQQTHTFNRPFHDGEDVTQCQILSGTADLNSEFSFWIGCLIKA